MLGFPTLILAFTAHIAIDPPITVGAVSQGGTLAGVPIISNYSFLRSEPDYPIKVDALFNFGADYIRSDPSGKLVRPDVHSVLSDKSGAVIVLKYGGIVTLTEATGKVQNGSPDAKTTDFGDIFTQMLFETGSEELKGLEGKIYVGSGRFILEKDKPTIAEYKISEVSV